MLDSIERLRADTPGCREVVHLNNAGSALPPRQVVDRVVEHLRLEQSIGGYEAAADAAGELAAVYDSLAGLIGARREEIALVDSATRAWLTVFTALPLRQGDRILTTRAEYSSNIIAMMAAARSRGVVVEPVPSTGTGEIDLDALARALDDDVRLVAVSHAPTNGGLLQPAREIGELVRRTPALYLLDACQTVGQVPIDVGALGVDFLSATGRKYLRGPRGTGLLYVRHELIGQLEPVHVDLHSADTDGDTYRLRDDARRFELWESNVAAMLGLGAAATYYRSVGVDAAWQRIQALGDALRARLADVPGATVRDIGAARSGIVSFTLATANAPNGPDGPVDADEVARRLRDQRINVSVSSLPSTPWDMTDRGIDSVVRASVHYYNDDADLDALATALRGMTERQR